MTCKCVCKPWLDLLATPEFVKSHLSRSVPGLAAQTPSKTYRIIEFADELDLNYSEEGHWNIVLCFKLPFRESIHSSANGLIFLEDFGRGDLIVCNPITRDYITLPRPQQPSSGNQLLFETYGFGVSRMTDQYKVIRIFVAGPLQAPLELKPDRYEGQVYTVGTGSWRKIAPGSPLLFSGDKGGVLLNGHLHWLVKERATNSYLCRISCLDLETELFSTISPPPPLVVDDLTTIRELSVLKGCLCVCDISHNEHVYRYYEMKIWLMKGYGDETSWTEEFITAVVGPYHIQYVRPIKVFEDGNILMRWGWDKLLYYCGTTNSIYQVFGEDGDSFRCATIYASSFLALKTFAMENVRSF